MILFAPSILSADFSHLGNDILRTREGGAQIVHIDVMDGSFVPQLTFGDPVIRSIRPVTDQLFDVHLMVWHPERYVKRMADCGADLITFHLEAAEDPRAVIDAIHAAGKKAGLAIKPATPVEAVRPLAEAIDMLLVMTVEPGFGGQSYIPASTGRIAAARRMFAGLDRETDIEVDGGIKTDNVRVVLDAGANVIVAGSAVYRGDIRNNTRKFMEDFALWEAENE